MTQNDKRPLTHTDLVKGIATKTGLSVPQTSDAVNALLDVIAKELRTTGVINLKGIGKLVRVHQTARTGRNPRTGDPVLIPERETVKFRRSVNLVL